MIEADTALLAAMRHEAAKVGPLHAWWDIIFDAEALADGRPTLLPAEQIRHLLVEAQKELWKMKRGRVERRWSS